ncbi:hypothetical protein N9261_00560 [bacterium]|nr:hypothetical protein [bacterium]
MAGGDEPIGFWGWVFCIFVGLPILVGIKYLYSEWPTLAAKLVGFEGWTAVVVGGVIAVSLFGLKLLYGDKD